MAREKYHATMHFGQEHKALKFTAVDLDRLMARFKLEVDKEVARSKAARDYYWIEPHLSVEVK